MYRRMLLSRIVLAAAALAASLALAAPQPPAITGKAWLLADLSSGQILGAENPEQRVEPASLTKIMTVYVVLGALKEKRISLEQTVNVSERAWKAPGSRMFIQPRMAVTVEELVRGVVVQSGNDACIALAEHVAGTEEAFVERMNREAARLGMTQTRFTNASGLPDPNHYTSARDLYLLTAAMIRDFPEAYTRYYPQKEFKYNNIAQLNRNRLLWLDPSVDGVKTGHTDSAGYCLVASSRRDERRLVSVLLGSSSESVRAQDSLKLLNWGYLNFDSVRLHERGKAAKTIEVWKGAANAVAAGFDRDLVLTVPRGEADKLKAELLSQQPLVAPIAKGQKVGALRVTLEGKPLGEFPLVALEPVPAAGIFGRAWDTLKLWVK